MVVAVPLNSVASGGASRQGVGGAEGMRAMGELIDGGWGAHEYDGGVYRVWEIFRSAPRW